MKYLKYLKMMTVSVMAAVLFLTVAPQEAFAQLSKKQQKQLQKERNKEYERKINEYKSEKWKLGASSRSIEVALLEHYEKLGAEDNVEFVGEVSQCQSINICKQSALNNAINRYAMLASGNVKGRIESLLRADANMPQVEIDKFVAAYENQVKAEVGSVLVESYSIVKEDTKRKTNQYKTFFILNEEKAMLARKRAMERSLLETQIAVKEAEEISRYVNEGFSLE
jgi:hypothetical protein